MTTGRRCYEKMLEPVCATIDCKFDARDDEDCAHTTRPVNVSVKGHSYTYTGVPKVIILQAPEFKAKLF